MYNTQSNYTYQYQHSFPTRRSSDLFSNGTGWVNPGAFLSDNRTYVIIALWEGQIVNQTAMYTPVDRKSTRLNSSHLGISYAVFYLKKKKKPQKSLSNKTYNTKQRQT